MIRFHEHPSHRLDFWEERWYGGAKCNERMRKMKKAVAWILILMLALSMAACGGSPAPAPSTQESTVPAETTEATPPETAPAETEAPVPTVLARPLYGEILDSYFDALLQGFSPEEYIGNGLNYLPGLVKDVTKIGYSLEDLDGDGSTELLIGAVGEPNIYAMYTVKDGEETLVIDAGERNSYRLSSDGVFVNNGSNSAAQSAYFLYTFADGDLALRDGLVFDANVDSKNPWFYVQDTNWDPATYQAMDTASAEAILNDLDTSIRPIAYIPFSEYTS